MAEIRFRRCHGPYFFAEQPRKKDRKSCPKDGQQNVKGRIRHWGCHRPCGHAQDGLEKNVHIRTFFQKDSFEKRAPHSRYFSDELGALFIYNNIEHMFTRLVTYGIIFIWKKIYLLLKKILFRMVEDMCTRFNIIWSGARNTGRKFWPMM